MAQLKTPIFSGPIKTSISTIIYSKCPLFHIMKYPKSPTLTVLIGWRFTGKFEFAVAEYRMDLSHLTTDTETKRYKNCSTREKDSKNDKLPPVGKRGRFLIEGRNNKLVKVWNWTSYLDAEQTSGTGDLHLNINHNKKVNWLCTTPADTENLVVCDTTKVVKVYKLQIHNSLDPKCSTKNSILAPNT